MFRGSCASRQLFRLRFFTVKHFTVKHFTVVLFVGALFVGVLFVGIPTYREVFLSRYFFAAVLFFVEFLRTLHCEMTSLLGVQCR